MFITGYPPEDIILRDDLLSEVDKAIVELSRITPETHIVMGYPRKSGHIIYNTAGVLYQNKILLLHSYCLRILN